MNETSLNATKQFIKRFGGTLAKDQKSLNVILTSMKSSTLIKRHLDTYQVPVVNTQWIKDSINEKQLLNLQAYTILFETQSTLNIISEDQAASQPITDNTLTKNYTELIPDVLKVPNKMDQSSIEYQANLRPFFINTRYPYCRPTKLDPTYNQKIVAYLSLLKKVVNWNRMIKAYPRKITSATEAEKIKDNNNNNNYSVGPKIKELIRFYLEHGTVPGAEKLLTDVRLRTLRLFTKCFGVGSKTARDWWDMGYRCLQEVLDMALLTTRVKLGIQLLPDFTIKMNRKDVEELEKIINDHIKKIDPNLFVTVVGGHSRGKESCGDLDIIMLHNQSTNMKDIFDQTLIDLQQNGYIKHVIWKSDGVNYNQKFHSKQVDRRDNLLKSVKKDPATDDLPKMIVSFVQPSTKIMRQVDLVFASKDQHSLALLAWTGFKQFERSICDYAKKYVYKNNT
ncbi:unnamed protein product [Cunninghamella echinulata]